MHKSVSTQATPRHAAMMHHVGKVRHERTTATRSAGLPASVANARAQAIAPAPTASPAPPESLAYDYAKAYATNGNSSGPVCQPGSTITELDGQMHVCQ